MFFALNMTWTHCEVYWDLDFEPLKRSGGQPVALGGAFGVWLGTFFCTVPRVIGLLFRGVVFEAIFGTLKSGPWRRGPSAPVAHFCRKLVSLFNRKVWRIVAVRHSDRGF